MKRGLLLINLGTPDAPSVPCVRAYLREFLTDRRVINLPAPLRYLLVYGFILPFRPRQSAKAYQAIWTENGAPLLATSRQLTKALQQELPEYHIALGMRYGNPSIAEALEHLKPCDHITILPLYPQYASAATGSSLEKTLTHIATYQQIPSLSVIHHFYQHPAYIHALLSVIRTSLTTEHHLLLSYHGIPERPLKESDRYQAECHQTSSLLAEGLGLTSTQYTTVFQSRLGKISWIKPYLETTLPQLKARGIKKLAVACPSFVVDCLETIEEIGIRAKAQWHALGGEELLLIPCLNTHPQWIQALIEIAKIDKCAIPMK